MRRLFITHLPSPTTLYTPQWTSSPKRASWNPSRAARLAALGRYPVCALLGTTTEAAIAAARISMRRRLDVSTVGSSDRLLSGDEPVDATGQILQIGGIAGGNFRREES